MDNKKFSAPRHILPEKHFAELARGAGSPEVIRELWESQRSRKLALLLAFWNEIDNDPELQGPLAPLDSAWQMLEMVREKSPQHFSALLNHPQVGSWLAYTVRYSRGEAETAAPFYVDFGQLNTLALAGAALSGQSWTTQVPLRDGRVMVPCFGMAYFPDCDQWDTAYAGVADGRLWFRHKGRLVHVPPSGDATGWWALRQITVGEDPTLTVWLDDLDPLRDMADPIPPKRLSEVEVERWTELLKGAWEILSQGHPAVADSLAVGVVSLVPLPTGEGWDTRSASTGDAFGAVMCSLPPDAVTLAVSLSHEFAHIRLGGLMHLLPITTGGDGQRLYAPWRDDPRPLGGLIQGVYAFVSIAEFWRRQRHHATGIDREMAEFEYRYARAQAEEGLATARSATGLTVHGVSFLDSLADGLGLWSDDPTPGETAALAIMVAAAHRTGWRLRHCQPDEEDIATLVSAWKTGSSRPVRIGDSTVMPDRGMQHWSQGRLGLARRRIQCPQRYEETPTESWGRELSSADLALFAGDITTAVKGFVEQIAADPHVDSWAGLGLALSVDGSDRAGVALLERPEVVRAVYRQILAQPGRHPSPIDVARWVGSVVSP